MESSLVKRMNLLFALILTSTTIIQCDFSLDLDSDLDRYYLFGSPMKPPKSNLIIEASLTRLNTNERWTITETLAATSEIHGKIHIVSDKKSIDVFYHEEYDMERLIIEDLDCEKMRKLGVSSYWNKPKIFHDRSNFILLAGPSVIYRLSDKSLKWKDFDHTVIGGVHLKQIKTNIKSGTIIASYKSNNTDNVDNIVRLDFSGEFYNYYSREDISENFTMDIISIREVNENLDAKVEPTTGIGCPYYFHGNRSLPEVKTRQLHFSATEMITNLNGNEKTNLEVFIDLDKKITRVETKNGYTINDFNLAVSYIFKDYKCTISPFSETIEGLIGGQLSINEFTWTNGLFQYVGKTVYEPRAQGIFDTWELIENGRKIDGILYDKVVTTQYMAKLTESEGSETSNNYIPVAVTRIAYKNDPNYSELKVHESRRRDITEYQRAITQSQYQNFFQISDCFSYKDRKSLTFDIRSESSGYPCSLGPRHAEENIMEFIESFRNLLTKSISPLRINLMNFDFQANRITSTVEFLNKPPLEKSFRKSNFTTRIGIKLLNNPDVILAKSVDECLKSQTSNAYFSHILYCPDAQGFCTDLDTVITADDYEDEFEGPKRLCNVYTFPLTTSQWRLAKEVELSGLHRELLRTEQMVFSMSCPNCTVPDKEERYRVINVMDYRFSDDKSNLPLFSEVQKSAKLNPSFKSIQMVKDPIRHFADCYNKCASSNDCLSFSHCINGDANECLISSELYTHNSTVNSTNCTTHGRDFIDEYQKAPDREFVTIQDESTFIFANAKDCAAKCYQTESCLTFQYCTNNNLCSFSGPYTPRLAKYSTECGIYVPKKSRQFILTGRSLVDQVITTVSGMNLEQCAALCADWKDGNESCVSFNYCPKSRLDSSCALTKYSVSDSGVTPFSSAYCYNFELIKSQVRSNSLPAFLNNDEMGNAGTSISLAFLVVGLALGVALASIYHTIHNRNSYSVTNAEQESDG